MKSGRNIAETSNRSKQSKAVRFNRFAYFVFMLGCLIFRKRVRGKDVQSESFKTQKKKGAMLVLANHVSALDFVYFTPPFLGVKINFVVAENMSYSQPVFAKLLDFYHAIKKKQFYADFQCIKNIKKYLDAGISVLLCPEGKVSAEGRTGEIPDSTARLVQWLGYPVATLLTKGGGLVRPKWAFNTRKGSVVTYCDMLFSAEDTKRLSKAELLKKIKAALEHNENEFQIANQLAYTGEGYAEGLERLLYKCPKCGSDFTVSAAGNLLKCDACGNSVIYKNTGELIPQNGKSVCPERIDLWCDYEKKAAADMVKNNDFMLSNAVNLFTENEKKNGYKYIASGTLTLDRHALCFDTEQRLRPAKVKLKNKREGLNPDIGLVVGESVPVEDEYKKLRFELKNCRNVANIPGESLDMTDGEHTYRMMFTDVQASTLYAYAIEAIADFSEESNN